jgi:hypothetical protein
LERPGNQTEQQAPERVCRKNRDKGEGICGRARKPALKDRGEGRADQDGEHPVGQPGEGEREDRFADVAKCHNRQPSHGDGPRDEERAGWSAEALHYAGDGHKWMEKGERGHADDQGPLKAVEIVHMFILIPRVALLPAILHPEHCLRIGLEAFLDVVIG